MKKLLDIYKKFLELRCETEGPGSIADYEWYSLPHKFPFSLMAYSQMLQEHSRELSNSINELHRYIVNLKVWEQIISELDEYEKFELLIEMISPFATLSINLIYVIRSRFIFSAAHLCHQANKIKLKDEWKDDLPSDESIYFKHADAVGASWRGYQKLKIALEKTGNKKFTKSTKDFRNKYNHRYSPRIELGHTEFVKRKVDTSVSYLLGYTEPLTLSQLTPLLSEQYLFFLKAHDCYKKLVSSQICFMVKTLEEMDYKL